MATEQELFINEVPLQDCSCKQSSYTAQWRCIDQSSNQSNVPAPRGGHTSLYIPQSAPKFQHSIITFGGANREASAFNDLHSFNLQSNTWSLIDCNGTVRPPPRSGHTAVLIDDRFMLIHGGQNVQLPNQSNNLSEPVINLFDDVWKFDLATSKWSQISITQSIKRNCAAANVMNGAMCVVGGSDENGPCGTIHCLDLSDNQSTGSWKLIQTTGDERDNREMHALTSQSNEAWLTSGGRSELGVLNSIYSFNQSNRSWKMLGQASPRCGHSLHMLDDQTACIFGGIDGLTFYNDVTTFNTSEGSLTACSKCHGPQGWYRVAGGAKTEEDQSINQIISESSLPAHRFAHSMTAVASSSPCQFVLHGGMNDERDLNDTFIITMIKSQ